MSSYRPICNMQIYEKIVEEVLKKKIVGYLQENNIILAEHHGGRKAHSTATAKAVLEEAAHKNLDKNKLGVLVSTDMTSAFDTVDHSILKKKLRYYGIEGRLMKVLDSYLDERTQYVEIQLEKSNVTKSLKCSVVQGSKLSGILYTIYTNEVVKLHELIKDKEC